jgi:putative hemolysin
MLDGVDDLLRVVGVLALVGANAFFVVGEYSIITARRGAVSDLARRGRRGAHAALRLMDDPVRVISTVQVGITAVGILTGAVGEPLVRDLVGGGLPDWAGFALGFALVTYLSVVLGELVPKALTLDRAERLAVLVAPSIELLALPLRPIIAALQGSAQVLLRPFGVKDVIVGDSVTSPDELRALVDEAEGAGIIPRAQEELLHNVFDFPTLEARDVMTPASDVAWLGADQSAGDALDHVIDAAYSRYPVGNGSLDHVIGMVHIRDLLAARRADPSPTVGDAAHDVTIVPETKDLGALLRELREQRQQLAVVADEYGRTLGLVTIEDILEEIVGEIEDEYDLPDDKVIRLDDGSLRVAGSITIDDFNELAGSGLPNRAHTLAGLVFQTLGRRPVAGDRVPLHGAHATIERVDGARITQLRVTVGPAT